MGCSLCGDSSEASMHENGYLRQVSALGRQVKTQFAGNPTIKFIESKFRKKKEMKERRLQRAELRGGDAPVHLDHGVGDFYDDDDLFWSSGILKFFKIDFVWQFVHRLKLAFL